MSTVSTPDRTIWKGFCLASVLACIAWILAQVLHAHFKRQRNRSAFIRLHNCKPAASTCSQRPWLLGLDFLLQQMVNVFNHRFAESIRKSFDRYGITYEGRILRRTFIATLDPANLEAMMKSNASDYNIIPGRQKLIRVIFGEGVFSTDGPAWRESRLVVKAGMSNFCYDSERFETHAKALLSHLREKDNQKIDFVKPVFAYTIDVASDILFGQSTMVQGNDDQNTVDRQFARDFTFLGRMARVLTLLISQIPFLAETMFGREYIRAQQRVFDYVDSHVRKAFDRYDVSGKSAEENELRDVERPSIADGMVRRVRDVGQVRSELLNLLLAGHDTVGIALSELFYCLARKPEVWRKLRNEAKSSLNGRLPSQADLKQMQYLSWTINEAIRVRPTLSVHARRANCDTVLPRGGGVDGKEPLFVEKGQYVVYSNYALYRNPAVFGEDIDEFRPERWESAKPKTFEYLNFGAGPRSCPGKDMGWTMLAYITARLAQEVEEIVPMDDRPWQEAKAFSFHNRHGVHLALKMEDK